jgi:ABC-2 type transport system ATP-binding protein
MGVLWATHLVDEAERAVRVLVLHRGRLLCDGTPTELLAKTGQPTLADAFLELTGRGADARPAAR